MRRLFLGGKIHKATVTKSEVDYDGSLGIDTALMRLAGITEYEQIHVMNVTNGERLVTYAISGQPGEIALYGAAAHKGKVGDVLIIMSFVVLEGEEIAAHKPRKILVDSRNQPV